MKPKPRFAPDPIPAAVSVEVPRGTLERYVGNYQMNNAPVVVAWGKGDTITIQPPGQIARALRATSATQFDVEGVPARVVFNEENGKVASLVIKLPNRDMKADRVPD